MKKRFTLFFVFTLLLTFTAQAGVGPYAVQGQPVTELYYIENNPAITVKNEEITFDYSNKGSNPVIINGKIKSVYEMVNTSGLEQSVQLAFTTVCRPDQLLDSVFITADGEEIGYEPNLGPIF